MLVLDRRLHEGFWIDDRIFVKVLAIGRHRVKLGIDAPEDLPVVRQELRDRRENLNGRVKGETEAEEPKARGSIRSARERS
jgi:carbon storage regulator